MSEKAMNSNCEDTPHVPLVPVSMRIQTEKPKHGWWKWAIEFLEESYENGIVVPWNNTGRKRRRFKTTLRCSGVVDPIPELHRFLYEIDDDSDFEEWCVDEEGRYFTMYAWYLDEQKLQLHISIEGRDEDFLWDFVINRDAFLIELNAAYASFGAWGGWGVRCQEEVIKSEHLKDVLIDDGETSGQESR